MYDYYTLHTILNILTRIENEMHKCELLYDGIRHFIAGLQKRLN